MNQLIENNGILTDDPEIVHTSSDQFIKSNSQSITVGDLKHHCIIPSFKDNESTISHTEFIETVGEICDKFFLGQQVLTPAIRVSHPIKGRIPEAMGKPVTQLKENEKTIYYERMAFIYEVPGISSTVNKNKLTLTVGGVRAYNLENLYSRKTEERFKVFVGFQNCVCLNLCISTDGFKQDLKVRTLDELGNEVFRLLTLFETEKQINSLERLGRYNLSDTQFATLIGRSRLYNYLPADEKKVISSMPLNDTQISIIARGYYQDKNFKRSEDGNTNLWNIYNLFTGAAKSSYIDSFLDRNAGSSEFVINLADSLESGKHSWYLS